MKTCKYCNRRSVCQELCADVQKLVDVKTVPVRQEKLDQGLYEFLVKHKVASPVVVENPHRNKVTLVAILYWSDGMSPLQISKAVDFSIEQISEIISELQFIIERIINTTDVRSNKVRVAVRSYFYERKPIKSIARDLNVNYLNLYRSIRGVVERADASDEILKQHISNIEGIINENIQKK